MRDSAVKLRGGINVEDARDVDEGRIADYEELTLLRTMLNVVIIPAFFLLRKTFILKLLFFSRRARSAFNNIATFQALEDMYTYNFATARVELGVFELFWTHLWLNLINCKAVRNRLKLVKCLLRMSITNIAENPIRIVCLASGSARAVLETIEEMDIRGKIDPTLIDTSQEALDFSRGLAEVRGIRNLELIAARVQDVSAILEKTRPHIVEMVGLLDYLRSGQALRLFRRIYSSLPDGGIFITGNIDDNPERYFCDNVIRWTMVYRKPEELHSLIVKAGFQKENIRIIYEPLHVHALVLATK